MSALALPLYNTVAFNHDSYVSDPVMSDLLPHARRWWRVNGRIVSMQLKDGGAMVKRVQAFTDHCQNEETFLTLMEQCYTRGIKRPSSYSDFFYQVFTSPRLRYSVNALFASHFRGGWQQARATGALRGHFRKYDINSAYFWSLSHGLPETTTIRFSRRPSYSDIGGFAKPGLYVVSLEQSDFSLPYPFNFPSHYYLASTHEIEHYQLPVTEYHSGVTWTASRDVAPVLDLILSLPASKQVSRSYWGRWASGAQVECCTESGKRWKLHNPVANFVWAHIIVSRVKMRIWQEATRAAHVFVDSVVTTRELPTGAALGDWRLVQEYPTGVHIQGAGTYGPPENPTEKHSGKAA